jgi:hypothetical protein
VGRKFCPRHFSGKNMLSNLPYSIFYLALDLLIYYNQIKRITILQKGAIRHV